MLKTITDNVLLPLFTRIGTMAGAALLGAGANQELVEQAILGIIAMLLIAVDLAVRWLIHRKEQ